MAIVEGPSKRGYVVGGVVAVVGIGVGVFLMVSAVVGLFSKVDAFQRVSVPGTAEVQFTEAGGHSVYGEGTLGSGQADVRSVTIEPADGGEALVLDPYTATVTYEAGSRSGRGLFSFDVPSPGRYLVTVDGTSGVVAVGAGLGENLAGRIASGALAATLAFLVGGGVLLSTFFRRRRARPDARNTPQGPGWAPPPGQQGWGPPPPPGQQGHPPSGG